ncbi:MAG: PorV/PorQ family protein, partial [candidate division WOR-3 bacterium]
GFLLLAGSARSSEGPNPGAVFLEIWPGTRPTALAGAFSSSADDALATYYNTGGLAFITGTDITLMHVNWLPGLYPGMYYEFLGVAHELPGKGTLGFNFIYLTTGSTDVIDGNGNHLGTYTTFDFSPSASYGFKVAPNLGVGIGLKFIYSFLVPDWVFKAMPELGIDAGGTGTTWAADAGLLYRPLNNLWLGASISNLGPNISYVRSGEADPLPRMLRLGLRYSPLNSDLFRLSILPEVQKVMVGLFYDQEQTKTLGEKLNYAWFEA